MQKSRTNILTYLDKSELYMFTFKLFISITLRCE